MDWLAALVIMAIIGQYALIKWLIHKHEHRLKQAQRQQRASFLRAAAKQQQKTYFDNKGLPNE